MSPGPCRPFDKNRQGINLGEGSAAIILQTEANSASNGIELLGGCVTNDANHVSAPSRTGQELAYAILQSLSESKMGAEELNFVSAHGTATSYNDEMEAKALNLAGIAHLPTHSLKGYFGHTLGAAGLIETIMCFQSLKNNLFIPGTGFGETGTTVPVNICTSKMEMPMNAAVKTMAGFGGCNAALVFSKIH
jgi:3-oxoacyl-[acyl-carrier-protein] synthase I